MSLYLSTNAYLLSAEVACQSPNVLVLMCVYLVTLVFQCIRCMLHKYQNFNLSVIA